MVLQGLGHDRRQVYPARAGVGLGGRDQPGPILQLDGLDLDAHRAGIEVEVLAA
jgi:hypothetical protein